MRANTRVRVHFSLKLSLRRTNVKLVCTRQHLQSCNNLKTDSKTVRNVVKNKVNLLKNPV